MAVTVKKSTGSEYHKIIRERLDKASFQILSRAGETAVTYARKNGSYKDRTTNLRNSIGYVIMKDGIIISGKFNSGGIAAEKASKYALDLSAEIAQKHSKGYVLIVVAGMEYAAYVEALNYDVLSGAGNVLKLYINEIVQQIKAELKNL